MYHLHMYADIVLFCADNESPIPVGELRERYGIPRSTLQRYLAQLVEFGWIKRVKRGYYYPAQTDVTEAVFKIVAMS